MHKQFRFNQLHQILYLANKTFVTLSWKLRLTEVNLYIRPMLDGRINRKPNGQIFDQTAELIKKRIAEFHSTAE